MKHTAILLFIPSLAALSLTSCVVPAYNDPGLYGSAGVSYGTYAVLPVDYEGDAYYYGGRYYSGGRYESGRFYDHGHAYNDRYYHNGQYYYGGRHEHHGNPGNDHHDGNHQDPRNRPSDRPSSWQQNAPSQPYHTRYPQSVTR